MPDLDVHDDEEGIFFVNGKETRASSYGRTGARQVIFGVPALPVGEYTVIVRALRGDRLESGTLATSITV